MLTVAETVPGGPSHKKLEPGDVLVRVNGELITRFVPLEAILDDHVGKTVRIIDTANQALSLSTIMDLFSD
jgi:pro-apoptotic serine protease NMA111